MPAFTGMTLRKQAELDALRLYLLFVAKRNTDLNFAHISYDKIEAGSGVERARIKRALTILAVHNLVHIEHLPSNLSKHGISSAYRLTTLESNIHMGTRGRAIDADNFGDAFWNE